jgi:hypothetical protein
MESNAGRVSIIAVGGQDYTLFRRTMEATKDYVLLAS